MVGRIDGTVDGWPVSLIAEYKTLVFDVSRLRTLITIITIRRGLRSTFRRLLTLLARTDTRLMVRVGWLGSFELLPNPSYVVDLTFPR